MATTYNAIVMASRPLPGLSAHNMEVICNDGFSFLLLCQPEWISIIVVNKMPENEQFTWPSRKKFTDADMDALVARIAGHPINETVMFGELWKNRIKAQMISLEEGILNHWFFGRTVLAGDAIHKVTPNSALGGNVGMEDAVVIANALVDAIAAHPNKKPTDAEICDKFQDYQDTRMERVRAIVKAGAELTRLQAYDGWKFYLNQRWVMPMIGLDFLAKNIAHLCTGAPKLSYVPFAEERGLLGWDDTKSAQEKARLAAGGVKKRRNAWHDWSGDFEAVAPELLGALLVLSLSFCVFFLVRGRQSVPGVGRPRASNFSLVNATGL